MIRVLIVDDAQIIRSSLSKSVERFDGPVAVSGTAANGEKALEWLEANYADLCITDIKMPAMDGLELIERINSRYPWMASLVVSSYDDFQYAKKSIQLKALDYIMKPVDQRLLNDALHSAIIQLREEREREAARLLIRKLPDSRMWLDRWVEHAQTMRWETMPMLIVKTLELLQGWVGDHHYLLTPLSNLWLHAILEELKKEKLRLEFVEGEDIGLGGPTLQLSEVRSYYRLCAVRRLEEGSNRLIEAIRGSRDHHTVKVIQDIMDCINKKLGEKINLQELADAISMSKTYMCTLFKQETRMTVWNYIMAERMKRARDLLLKENLKIYEIADRVGYEDVDHFTQLFKKHFGLSPVDYKKRMES